MASFDTFCVCRTCVGSLSLWLCKWTNRASENNVLNNVWSADHPWALPLPPLSVFCVRRLPLTNVKANVEICLFLMKIYRKQVHAECFLTRNIKRRPPEKTKHASSMMLHDRRLFDDAPSCECKRQIETALERIRIHFCFVNNFFGSTISLVNRLLTERFSGSPAGNLCPIRKDG